MYNKCYGEFICVSGPAKPLTRRDELSHKVTDSKGSLSIWLTLFPFTIIQDRLWCDKVLTTSVVPEISLLCTYKMGSDLGYQPFKAGQ